MRDGAGQLIALGAVTVRRFGIRLINPNRPITALSAVAARTETCAPSSLRGSEKTRSMGPAWSVLAGQFATRLS